MQPTKLPRVSLPVLCGVVTAFGLLAMGHAQPAGAQPTEVGRTADQYQDDIGDFEMLYRGQVTPEQVRALLAIAEDSERRRGLIGQIDSDPTVVAAMREMRGMAALGRPLSDEAWERLNTAREGAMQRLGVAEEDADLWGRAEGAVRAILPLFTDRQKLLLGAEDYEDYKETAEEIADALAEHRDLPAAGWQEWRADVANELGHRNVSEAGRAGVLALLDEARALTPDQYWGRQADLQRRLEALVMPDMDPEGRDEGAVQVMLGPVLEHRGFTTVLREYLDLAGPAGPQ